MPSKASNRSYISLLSSDSYLEGLLVLYYSLKLTQPEYPFVVLIDESISAKSREILLRCNIRYEVAPTIKNPTRIDPQHPWARTYSKLNVFGYVRCSKLVFLDADMLVVKNIDELFDRPHMSAVNAGGMLPRLRSWAQLNSGLMVVEPSLELYKNMLKKVGFIERKKRGSDQDFLQQYFPCWPKHRKLHLNHQYHIFECHLRGYKKLGYSLDGTGVPVKVIHYAGHEKPWKFRRDDLHAEHPAYEPRRLWHDFYKEVHETLLPEISGVSESLRSS